MKRGLKLVPMTFLTLGIIVRTQAPMKRGLKHSWGLPAQTHTPKSEPRPQ